MGREAILVGNSVTYLDVQKSVPRRSLERTMQRIADVFAELPDHHAFHVVKVLDETPRQVRDKVERAALRARATNSLFLFYYFGHGALSEDYELRLVHPSGKKGIHAFLKLSTITNIFDDNDVRKSLSILDCCYSGVRQRKFTPKGEHCILASTTPTARAYIQYSSDESPIGAFSNAILDGLFLDEACVSATDNRITVESLFKYARQETMRSTEEVQEPYLHGHLGEQLSVFVRTPEIVPGLTGGLDEKTAYFKLFVICRTLLSRAAFNSIRQLYGAVLHRYRKSFLTPFKKKDGDITYRPAQPTVLLRYIRFLRALGIVEPDDLRLTRVGVTLLRDWKSNFNQKLVERLERYLEERGLNRVRIDEALGGILARRRLPTRTEVLDYLGPTGHRITREELGLVLDLLGYVGAVRVATERVYFPW